jgi:uncharacterized protein YwbE
MDRKNGSDSKPGIELAIISKEDQRIGKLTEYRVREKFSLTFMPPTCIFLPLQIYSNR